MLNEDQVQAQIQEKESKKMYFGAEQEQAIRDYLESECEADKNRIYNGKLKFAFEKMVESIINKYKLYSNILSYQELFNQTLSYAHEKLRYFKPEKNKKAYSYYGTIIKRELISVRDKENKSKKKLTLYEDVYRNVYAGDKAEEIYTEDNIMISFFQELVPILKSAQYLSEDNNDNIVRSAIIQIIEDWQAQRDENYDIDLKTFNKKFDKNYVLECIRNLSNLPSRDISKSLKKIKIFYLEQKKTYIEKHGEAAAI